MVSGVFSSPTFARAGPIVGQNAPWSGGKGIKGRGLDLVDGFAIDEPGDLIFFPTETIVMEFLAGVKAKVIHVFVSANAIDEIIELDVGGVFA